MKEKVYNFIRYIATSEEKDLVDSLETDQELNRFLITFWQRRDPTPGTPQNEFKEEHFRRFKFANARLGGWHTDQGRVYILYGPPVEMLYDIVNNVFYGDLEIWVYGDHLTEPEMPNLFINIEHNMVKFVFWDRMGFGIMEQIYSTQPDERVDPLVYQFEDGPSSIFNRPNDGFNPQSIN